MEQSRNDGWAATERIASLQPLDVSLLQWTFQGLSVGLWDMVEQRLPRATENQCLSACTQSRFTHLTGLTASILIRGKVKGLWKLTSKHNKASKKGLQDCKEKAPMGCTKASWSCRQCPSSAQPAQKWCCHQAVPSPDDSFGSWGNTATSAILEVCLI